MSLRLQSIALSDPGYVTWVKNNGSVFHLPEWLSCQPLLPALYAVIQDEQALGYFYVLKEKKYGITFIRNPHLTPHIGWNIQALAQQQTKLITLEKQAQELLEEQLKTTHAHLESWSLPPETHDVQILRWKGYTVQPKYTYRIDLNQPFSALCEGMKSGHRNHWNKALKDGVEVHTTEKYSEVIPLVLSTFNRNEKKIDRDHLQRLTQQFCRTGNTVACVAYYQGEPIAATLTVFHLDTAYLILSGYNQAIKHGGAGIRCVLQTWQELQKLGIKTFDFEGSMIPAVEQYFRGFGGTIHPYFHAERGSWWVKKIMQWRSS